MNLLALLTASLLGISLVSEAFGQAAPTTVPPPAQQTAQGSPVSPSPPARGRASWQEGDRCVQDNKEDIRHELKSGEHPVGPEILPATYFLPAGGPVELGVNEPFNPSVHYFGYLERSDNAAQKLLPRGAITAKRVPDDYSLVKKGILDKGDTLLTLQIPDSIGSFWQSATLYLWVCENPGRPKSVSELTMPVSSSVYCSAAVWTSILILYVGAALATSGVRKAHWYRYLDPV